MTLLLSVSTEDKARTVAQKALRPCFGDGPPELTLTEYPPKSQCAVGYTAKTSLRLTLAREDVFYRAMTLLKLLAIRWSVTVPDEVGPFEFNGGTNPADMTIPGVHSISFHVGEDNAHERADVGRTAQA